MTIARILEQDDPVRQRQCWKVGPRVRTAAGTSPRSVDRMERIGRHQHAGPDLLRIEGSSDRLLRQARARLSHHPSGARTTQDPGLRRQFSLESGSPRAGCLQLPGRTKPAGDERRGRRSKSGWTKALLSAEVYHHINTHGLAPTMATLHRSSDRRMGVFRAWRDPSHDCAAGWSDSRSGRNHRRWNWPCAGAQNQHVGEAALRTVQAPQAEGWTVGRHRAPASQRKAPRGSPKGPSKHRGRLTCRLHSTIGAHDSGCLMGGPFSLNLEA